jgi:hypothetical protein
MRLLMEPTIKLESGRTIEVYSINQEQTYAALFEGTPRKSHNDDIIESCRQSAVEKYGKPVIVIDPVRTLGPSSFSDPKADKLWGPREFLPEVTCYGMFQSYPVRSEREDHSFLLIVWFQDTFAFPIDAGVISGIRKVDWEASAVNWSL